MDDEILSKAMSWALVWFHQKFHFTWENSNLQLPKRAKTYISWKKIIDRHTVKLSKYCKSGSMFSSIEPVAASTDCRLGKTLFVLACQTSPSCEQCEGALPQELSDWFFSQKFWLSLWIASESDHSIARWRAGAHTWTQTWTVSLDKQVVEVLSAIKSQNNLWGVWILFRSVRNKEIEDSSELIPTLIHQTVCYQS